MDKLYIVSFDTQSNRVCREYEFCTMAPNKKAAIDKARTAWYSILGRKPHMFHCMATRSDTMPEYTTREARLEEFNVVAWRNANWLWQDTLDPRTPADKWRSCR